MSTPDLIRPYSPEIGPVPNITPFTYRDGRTYLDKNASLIYWINNVLVPLINDAVEQVINDSIQLQDPVMAGIVDIASSLTRTALDNIYVDNEEGLERFVNRGEWVVDTNDYPSLTAAVAALQSNGTLLIRPGVHTISQLSITGKSGIRIIGNGARIESPDGDKPIILINNCDDVTIEGISVTNPNATTRDSVNYGIRFEGCDNVVVDRVTVDKVECAGIIFLGGKGLRVVNSHVRNTLADAIHFTDAARDISVIGNTIENSGDDAIALVSYRRGTPTRDPVRNSTILGNTITNSRQRGIGIIGAHRVVCSHNTIDGTRAAGIIIAQELSFDTYGPEDVIVENNIVRNANSIDNVIDHAAIHVSGDQTAWPIKNILIKNNIIITPRWRFISIGKTSVNCVFDVVIEGNRLIGPNNTSSGIEIHGTTNIDVIKNLVRATRSYGIFAGNTNVGLIRLIENIVEDANQPAVAGIDAINIQGAVNLDAFDNRVIESASRIDRSYELNTITGRVRFHRNIIAPGKFAILPINDYVDLREPERELIGTAAPTTGANTRGNIVWNTQPAAGGYTGWICVETGTPGTWKGFGLIQA